MHNARDLETDEPAATCSAATSSRWEQHLADRLDGRPVDIKVEMDSQSILHRTLWLFAGAFAAAVVVLALLIWWTIRKGREGTRGVDHALRRVPPMFSPASRGRLTDRDSTVP